MDKRRAQFVLRGALAAQIFVLEVRRVRRHSYLLLCWKGPYTLVLIFERIAGLVLMNNIREKTQILQIFMVLIFFERRIYSCFIVRFRRNFRKVIKTYEKENSSILTTMFIDPVQYTWYMWVNGCFFWQPRSMWKLHMSQNNSVIKIEAFIYRKNSICNIK